jgi:MFS family permease
MFEIINIFVSSLRKPYNGKTEMATTQDLNSGNHASGSRMSRIINKLKLRPLITGLVPLFVLAHFSAHGVGAMLNPLMPMIRNDLGLNLTQAGLLMSAFTITNAFAQLPAGWLADRLGARFMILLAITGVAAAGFLISFSNSISTLVACLIIAAIMGGGYHPASAAAISSSVPEEYRGRALGVHLIGGTSAFWVLPLIIAPIAATWGWRMPFRIIPIPFALLGILVYFLLGKRSLSIAKNKQQTSSEPSATGKPTDWGTLVPFMVMSVLAGSLIASAASFLSFYAVDELHVPVATVPLLVAVSPAVGLVMAPLGGYLSDRFGGLQVILVLGLAAIPLIYLMGVTPTVPLLVILMVAIGLVTNTRMPTTESYIVGNTPEHRRSTMLGIYYFAGTGVAGPLTPFIGNLIDTHGYQQAFAISAAATAVVTIVCTVLLLRARTRPANIDKPA